jgi:hypothetical protein
MNVRVYSTIGKSEEWQNLMRKSLKERREEQCGYFVEGKEITGQRAMRTEIMSVAIGQLEFPLMQNK